MANIYLTAEIAVCRTPCSALKSDIGGRSWRKTKILRSSRWSREKGSGSPRVDDEVKGGRLSFSYKSVESADAGRMCGLDGRSMERE